MKHLLNNLSEEEKNRIRKQHEGGMKVYTERFKSLLESKSGNVKPLLNEQNQTTPAQTDTSKTNTAQIDNEESNKIVTNVASEGIKNVTDEMIKSTYAIRGQYYGYKIWGDFQGKLYSWDLKGVEGMQPTPDTQRGPSSGNIFSESIEVCEKEFSLGITDGKPGSVCFGFMSSSVNFAVYTKNSGTPCVKFFNR